MSRMRRSGTVAAWRKRELRSRRQRAASALRVAPDRRSYLSTRISHTHIRDPL